MSPATATASRSSLRPRRTAQRLEACDTHLGTVLHTTQCAHSWHSTGASTLPEPSKHQRIMLVTYSLIYAPTCVRRSNARRKHLSFKYLFPQVTARIYFVFCVARPDKWGGAEEARQWRPLTVGLLNVVSLSGILARNIHLCLSVYLCVRLSVYLFICRSIYIYLSLIYLSVNKSVYLSIHVCFYRIYIFMEFILDRS